ncbi:uncharacterized protein LOC126783816 [Argentina anserina]|uniref:uncharacterized protein LOC126783816 n=1 Tax=Argentina anserina TaxID=57926 RepID=UPI00217650A0|nr:uncharacterized protein LOC126783816 [Potentilla anserina]
MINMLRWNSDATTAAPASIVHHARNAYGDNYQDWSKHVETYLLGEDLWDVVESTSEIPKQAHYKAEFKFWRKNNARALHIIRKCCGPDQFALIRDETSASKAWHKLSTMFKPDNAPDNNEEEFGKHEVLYHAVKNNDWNKASVHLIKHPDAVRAKITYLGKTALHTAADAGHLDIVKSLVELMKEDDLAIKGKDEKTALVVATNRGDIEMARCMVTKNKKLVSIPDRSGRLPVVLAYRNSHWNLAKYLYENTPPEDLMPENGPNGATLISQCFYAKKYGKRFLVLEYLSILRTL